MTTKLAEQHSSDSPNTSEVHIQIIEREGEQFLVIREQSSKDQSKEYAVEISASQFAKLKRAVEAIVQEDGDEREATKPAASQSSPAFAHESEKEFASILDFYHIRWEYEPRSFVLERDESGNALKCFTPDFYLPDYDLFIEITTLKQSLVTKKNRKVRLLRELYPEINIKLLYASDYVKLLEKFSASKFRQEAQATTNNQ